MLPNLLVCTLASHLSSVFLQEDCLAMSHPAVAFGVHSTTVCACQQQSADIGMFQAPKPEELQVQLVLELHHLQEVQELQVQLQA